MAQSEGVIKYRLEFTGGEPPCGAQLRELSAWRRMLYRLGLIGQDPTRYEGYGFGNISQRCSDAPQAFLISGTQTGGIAELSPPHYCQVLECDPERNRLVASGSIQPSSEALTHGVLYALDPEIRFVMHVHSPALWSAAKKLGIPETSAEVPYGTPEMAREVGRLFGAARAAGNILSMAGHQDGLVSFGRSAEEAGTVLVRLLASAWQLETCRNGAA